MAFMMVTANDLYGYIGKKDTVIIDLRNEEEYEEAHIRGAINIPYEQLEEKKDIFKSYHYVIFYCDRGNASMMAAKTYDNKKQIFLSLVGGFTQNADKFIIDGKGKIIHN